MIRWILHTSDSVLLAGATVLIGTAIGLVCTAGAIREARREMRGEKRPRPEPELPRAWVRR